eukprot:TRINITY_DN13224_c0_g3_i2.p1 TRINITY_DN13224_c0_g3~~TRINITY_DN13224_c0_g3_i2.p1  ORF type:complete len:150 (+),score=14.10 TRINITY_DN13224_c0_g3_i2:499-948(+)
MDFNEEKREKLLNSLCEYPYILAKRRARRCNSVNRLFTNSLASHSKTNLSFLDSNSSRKNLKPRPSTHSIIFRYENNSKVEGSGVQSNFAVQDSEGVQRSDARDKLCECARVGTVVDISNLRILARNFSDDKSFVVEIPGDKCSVLCKC